MGRAWAAAFAVLVVLVGAGSASGGPAPPGATAQCRDGTYSFSQRRSGTCSHHGGVSKWLSGGAKAAAPITATSPSGPINLGKTVLLTPRTKTSGCVLGPNPDRRCSPGAYYSGLTKTVLCSSGFRTGTVRNVPVSEKHADEVEYGMTPASYGTTLEIDHIVSLEIGGSNDIANLFPEKANANPGYHVKDKLENKLHALVCAGSMTLHAAQAGIASDWQTLYRRVFGVSPAG